MSVHMRDIQSYRDLDAWRVGMDIVVQTYGICANFPQQERYELSAQMRRASVSIPSNTAEGWGRGTPREGLYFVRVAIGSTAELDTQLEAARRLRFVGEDSASKLQALIDRQRQLLYGMRRERNSKLGVATVVLACVLFWAMSASVFA
jgi:four helix bundle protein